MFDVGCLIVDVQRRESVVGRLNMLERTKKLPEMSQPSR